MLKKKRTNEKREERKSRKLEIKIKRNKGDGRIGIRKSNEERSREVEAGKIAQLSIYTRRKKRKSKRLKTQGGDDADGG